MPIVIADLGNDEINYIEGGNNIYHLKEITLRNGPKEKQVLVIEFTKKEKAIVAEFLMTDASMLNYEVLNIINEVLSGKSKQKSFSGNRCYLEIKQHKTYIEDLYEGMYEGFKTLPAYEIKTKRLKDLIIRWKKAVKKYRI